MKKLPFILLPLLIACHTATVTPAPVAPTYDFAAVDQLVTANIGLYNNNVMVLVSQNGQIIYRKNIVFDETTSRSIASASKWLSGAVIMTLVDEQKVALNDTLGKFLPIFTKYRKGGITIRQLFSHTSGFPGDSPQGYENSRLLSLAQAVDSLAVYTKLINPPGTAFYYGGVGMHIAGRVAEVVSGKSWQALFNEKIGTPCALVATYNPGNPTNPLIGGGVVTSARSYLNFLEMLVNNGLYNGKRVLSEAAVKTLVTDQTNAATIQYTPYPANPYSPYKTAPVRYGIGNWLDVVDGSGTVIESSSPGAFGTHPWINYKTKTAGIIFTMADFKTSQPASLQIREAIRGIVN
ncbi:serine hydrolase domain-containing protein [Fibrella aquatilis]|uniref:Beta-lactamase family protein n=1 Tax=Fibrella aquatilis TaxID=2817059 RepID=A0A939K0I1_9BACT|nr:serine hydrolase domain-containing protein [Fibrella aquatilis]MBO0932498.1 beta-lactamase family protein [Fibrella aquatilis]